MKLYYECPIEAIYMANNFGVEFYGWHIDKKGLDVRSRKKIKLFPSHVPNKAGLMTTKHREGELYSSVRLACMFNDFYVHPDSYEIFEIKPFDVILNSVKEPEIYIAGLPKLKSYQIILRDNKQFFNAKRED